MALFLRPAAGDINLTLRILHLFGDASGLVTNVQKSNVLPIQCENEHLALYSASTPLRIDDLPMQIFGTAPIHKEINQGTDPTFHR